MALTLLLDSFTNKCFHGSRALDTANWRERKLNEVKKIMLLLICIPVEHPRAMTEYYDSLCPLWHTELNVWRMEAGEMCLRQKVLKSSSKPSCSNGTQNVAPE